MRLALLDVLRCPLCQGALQLAGGMKECGIDDIVDGKLACKACGESYSVDNGIPRMLHHSLPGIREKIRETSGWVEMSKQQGWYELDDHVDAVLPYVNRDLGWSDPVWSSNEYSLSLLLDGYLKPGMRVLEVGAARCWSAQHVVTRGCEYVASDILADPKIGLGRGGFYIARVGHFERVQADGEHLPFASGSFDLTYCFASLHHALDLQAMVKEMARVTRSGGTVAALNEGTHPLGWSTNAPIQGTEKSFGINEHVHSVWSYLWSFLRAGLLIRQIDHADGYARLAEHPRARALLRLPRGKIWATLYFHNCVDYFGVSMFATKVGIR